MLYGPRADCSRMLNSETYATSAEYMNEIDKSTTISGSFGKMSASFTSSSKHVRDVLKTGTAAERVLLAILIERQGCHR
jgi:hypothetical protein